MERAIVQPEDVPIPLSVLDAVIHDWIVYCEEHYSIFVRGTPHECSLDSSELFFAAARFYGCRVCGNYHVCRSQVCTSEYLMQAQRLSRTIDDLKQHLGISYGYWCPVEEREPGLFVCRISGHSVRALAQHQPDIRHGAMLRENAGYRIEDGSVRSAKQFKPGSQRRPPSSLSAGTSVMRAERLFNTAALSYHHVHNTSDSPDDDESDRPATAEEADRDAGGILSKSNLRSADEDSIENEDDNVYDRTHVTTDVSHDVLGNRSLLLALSRTTTPEEDSRYATEYFEALEGLIGLNISIFQGPQRSHDQYLDDGSEGPPTKRPASAPPTFSRPHIPPPAPTRQREQIQLRGQLTSCVRKVVTHVHDYWERHGEIAQDARIQTYDLGRTVDHCTSYLLPLLLLLRRHRDRLRYIHAVNAGRDRDRGSISGIPQLSPDSAVWIEIEKHIPSLLLRGFAEPFRLRDTSLGEIHELWPADPFIAEAASHGVLDECERSYLEGPRYLDWTRWALRVLDVSPAALQDELWKTETHAM